MADIPAGYSPLVRTSPFLDRIGPLYSRGTGRDWSIGLRIEPGHTNSRGYAHGGVLSTLADITLGYTMELTAKEGVSLVTVSLSLDFTGGAKLGDWVEARVEMQKIATRLAFANAYITAGEGRKVIVRASGVFLVTEKPPASA
ncbi:MAG: PaaI family thioesterase [Betaproteobacteria bacterium]|nr:PaaI family thioesterase [Betaproteobacteria bacterium]